MKLVSTEVEEIIRAEMRKVTGIQCDICDGIYRYRMDGKFVKDHPKYFRVTTGHHDWGNDSHESIKQKDICPNCIDTFVSEYLKGHHGTAYIDIETAYCYPAKVDADDWDVKYGDYRIDEEGEAK